MQELKWLICVGIEWATSGVTVIYTNDSAIETVKLILNLELV